MIYCKSGVNPLSMYIITFPVELSSVQIYTQGVCYRVLHWDDPTDYFAHAQACSWQNILGVKNGGKSKIFVLVIVINQYNDRNIGVKAPILRSYHGMVMFYGNLNLDYHNR